MTLTMKKKIYTAPIAEVVDMDIDAVMSTTSPFGGSNNGDEPEIRDDEGQLSKENAGSWSDIWNNM